MYCLSIAVYHACKSHIVLPLCFIGVTIIRLIGVLFSTFLLLWITSFVDTGILKSEDDAKVIV